MSLRPRDCPRRLGRTTRLLKSSLAVFSIRFKMRLTTLAVAAGLVGSAAAHLNIVMVRSFLLLLDVPCLLSNLQYRPTMMAYVLFAVSEVHVESTDDHEYLYSLEQQTFEVSRSLYVCKHRLTWEL